MTHTDENNTGICDIFKDGGCLDYEELYLRKQKETKKAEKQKYFQEAAYPLSSPSHLIGEMIAVGSRGVGVTPSVGWSVVWTADSD